MEMLKKTFQLVFVIMYISAKWRGMIMEKLGHKQYFRQGSNRY